MTIPETASSRRDDGDTARFVAASDGHRRSNSADGHHHEAANNGADVAALLVENANLRAQLATLPVIEQAKGILIARFPISAEAAFALLRRWSLQHQRQAPRPRPAAGRRRQPPAEPSRTAQPAKSTPGRPRGTHPPPGEPGEGRDRID